MSIYIKEIGNNKIQLGGTVVTPEMLENGWYLYEGDIPSGIEFELKDGIVVPSISEQLIEACKNKVYELLDQTANNYDYKNFAEVAQFVNSSEWKAEADGLLAWQDAVWTKAYELLKAPIISIDSFMEQLPKYVSSTSTNN
jgi:hypothetical protein